MTTMISKSYLCLPGPIAYVDARRISLEAWRLRSEGKFEEAIDYLEREEEERGSYFTFLDSCPFCSIFRDRVIVTGCHRNRICCPLRWDKGKEEEKSAYSDDHSAPCSRNFWHYLYWTARVMEEGQHHGRRIYWSKRLYSEILATPETMVGL